MEKFLKIFTEIPLDEIERLSKLQGAELNEAKKILAFSATELAHGTKVAKQAEESAIALFAGGNNYQNMPNIEINMPKSIGILDFLVAINLFSSKSEARRNVEQGGIQIDGKKITDWKTEIKPADEIMVQKGKKIFLRVSRKN